MRISLVFMDRHPFIDDYRFSKTSEMGVGMSEPQYLVGEELLFNLMASAAMAGLTTKEVPKGTYIDFYEIERKARALLQAEPVAPVDLELIDEIAFEREWREHPHLNAYVGLRRSGAREGFAAGFKAAVKYLRGQS